MVWELGWEGKTCGPGPKGLAWVERYKVYTEQSAEQSATSLKEQKYQKLGSRGSNGVRKRDPRVPRTR